MSGEDVPDGGAERAGLSSRPERVGQYEQQELCHAEQAAGVVPEVPGGDGARDGPGLDAQDDECQQDRHGDHAEGGVRVHGGQMGGDAERVGDVLPAADHRPHPRGSGFVLHRGGADDRDRSHLSPCARPWTPPSHASRGLRSAFARTGRDIRATAQECCREGKLGTAIGFRSPSGDRPVTVRRHRRRARCRRCGWCGTVPPDRGSVGAGATARVPADGRRNRPVPLGLCLSPVARGQRARARPHLVRRPGGRT